MNIQTVQSVYRVYKEAIKLKFCSAKSGNCQYKKSHLVGYKGGGRGENEHFEDSFEKKELELCALQNGAG